MPGNKVAEERKRLRVLKILVDTLFFELHKYTGDMESDFDSIDNLRKITISLFPGQEKTFFMLYYPRLRRVLIEKYGARAEFYDHQMNLKFEEYFGGVNEETVN